MKKTLNKFLYESILDSKFDGISTDQVVYKAAADLNEIQLKHLNMVLIQTILNVMTKQQP